MRGFGNAGAPALALEQEAPTTGLTADEGKAQKLEGLRFTELTSSAPLRSETAELDQTSLLRMKRQRKPPQPSRNASRKRRASLSFWQPTIKSSAYRTMIMSPVAWRRRQRSAQRSRA